MVVMHADMLKMHAGMVRSPAEAGHIMGMHTGMLIMPTSMMKMHAVMSCHVILHAGMLRMIADDVKFICQIYMSNGIK